MQFQLMHARYAVFKASIDSLDDRVKALTRIYQRSARADHRVNQEGAKAADDLSTNPSKVMEIIQLLRQSVGEQTLRRIASDPLEQLLDWASPVELRNMVWGYLLTVGILGLRGL